jgi:ribosomal protein S7
LIFRCGKFFKDAIYKKSFKKGKESLAKTIVNKALFLFEHKLKYDSIKILELAVSNSKIDFDLKAITSKYSISILPVEFK